MGFIRIRFERTAHRGPYLNNVEERARKTNGIYIVTGRGGGEGWGKQTEHNPNITLSPLTSDNRK